MPDLGGCCSSTTRSSITAPARVVPAVLFSESTAVLPIPRVPIECRGITVHTLPPTTERQLSFSPRGGTKRERQQDISREVERQLKLKSADPTNGKPPKGGKGGKGGNQQQLSTKTNGLTGKTVKPETKSELVGDDNRFVGGLKVVSEKLLAEMGEHEGKPPCPYFNLLGKCRNQPSECKQYH